MLKDVNIGDGAIVGMGSIVTSDLPQNAINVGNPARTIRNGVNWDNRHIEV